MSTCFIVLKRECITPRTISWSLSIPLLNSTASDASYEYMNKLRFYYGFFKKTIHNTFLFFVEYPKNVYVLYAFSCLSMLIEGVVFHFPVVGSPAENRTPLKRYHPFSAHFQMTEKMEKTIWQAFPKTVKATRVLRIVEHSVRFFPRYSSWRHGFTVSGNKARGAAISF